MLEEFRSAEITKIVELSPRVREFTLTPSKPIEFIPGQFIVINGQGVERSYSISNSPGNKDIEIIVSLNSSGILSPWLFSLKLGANINISEPKGQFVLPPIVDKDICFICTCTGLGPFKSMIEGLSHLFKGQIYLIFGNRKKEDILYHEKWQNMAKSTNFNYMPVLSQEKWDGHQGYVHEVYKELFAKNKDVMIYVCGWQAMCKEARMHLKELGFGRSDYKFEQYD